MSRGVATLFAALLILGLAGCGSVGGSGGPQPQPGPSGGPGPSSGPAPQAVVTRNYDNARSGVNNQETQLSPDKVTATRFGKLFSLPVDGSVYGQPLYVPALTIGGSQHNVIFVATENDTAYAFDADHAGAPLWQTRLVNDAAGETSVPCDDVEGCHVSDVIGVTATPVISVDRKAIYIESRSVQNGSNLHKIHALDLTTGAEKFGGPTIIRASVPGTAADADPLGNVNFDPLRENARPGLLLLNGVVYICYASLDDVDPYHGWILGYSADTLKQVSVFNVTPNGPDADGEGGIWQNNGPAADSNGNIFLIVGNGTSDASSSNYGNSFLKLTPKGGSLTVADYFTPFNSDALNADDADPGSGGALLLPDQSGTSHPHLMVGAGKEGRIYLVDRDNMGKFNPTDDSQIVQSIPDAIGAGEDSNFYQPVFWNGNVYFSGNNDVIKAFRLQNGLLSTAPVMQASTTFGFPGAGMIISANGTTGAILWALDSDSQGTLHAYDPGNLMELWNSNQAGARDVLENSTHLNVPMVINGKVYVSCDGSVMVFGLLQ